MAGTGTVKTELECTDAQLVDTDSEPGLEDLDMTHITLLRTRTSTPDITDAPKQRHVKRLVTGETKQGTLQRTEHSGYVGVLTKAEVQELTKKPEMSLPK